MMQLSQGVTAKSDLRSIEFWPTIWDDIYTSRVFGASSIRLTHCCISHSLSGCHGSTHQVTYLDLFFLYLIYSLDVFCNIPFLVASYLMGELGRSIVRRSMGECSLLDLHSHIGSLELRLWSIWVLGAYADWSGLGRLSRWALWWILIEVDVYGGPLDQLQVMMMRMTMMSNNNSREVTMPVVLQMFTGTWVRGTGRPTKGPGWVRWIHGGPRLTRDLTGCTITQCVRRRTYPLVIS